MKKPYKFLLIFLIFSILLTVACAPRAVRKKKKVKDISLARILVKKELVVGMEDNFPPYVFRDRNTGTLKGFDIDFTKAICEVLDLKPKFKIIDWAQKDYLLGTRSIDCIINGFSYSPSRSKAFTLSIPYIRTAGVLTVREDSPYDSIEDVKSKIIGVQASSSTIMSIRAASKKYGELANIQTFASADSALVALENGEIEAIAHDVLVVNNLIINKGKPYKIIPEALDADEYVIAFKKGDIALKKKIEEALYILAENGTLEAISKKWFGSNIIIVGR